MIACAHAIYVHGGAAQMTEPKLFGRTGRLQTRINGLDPGGSPVVDDEVGAGLVGARGIGLLELQAEVAGGPADDACGARLGIIRGGTLLQAHLSAAATATKKLQELEQPARLLGTSWAAAIGMHLHRPDIQTIPDDPVRVHPLKSGN